MYFIDWLCFMSDTSKNKTLFALSSAAMGLGLGAKPAAAAIEEGSTLSAQFSFYAEDMIDPSLVSGLNNGSGAVNPERFEIPTLQVKYRTAIAENTEIAFTYAGETLSGASPWYVQPADPASDDVQNEDPVQVLSGATIEEERHEYNFNFKQYQGDHYVGLNFSYSTENDYKSSSFGINGAYSLNDKATTLEVAVSANLDLIEPTDPERQELIENELTTVGFAGRVEREDKDVFNALFGITQIINKNLLVNSSLSYARYKGFLSDPYKRAYIVDPTNADIIALSNIVADSRPGSKSQVAWSIASRYFVEPANAAIHADYRYYTNNWGINSHTIDLGWYQNFFDNQFTLAPQLRIYSQSSAEFYRDFYNVFRQDGFYSSDYRLSDYTAISGQLKATYRFEKVNLHASFERYISSGDNPGLVDFSFFSTGFDWKF